MKEPIFFGMAAEYNIPNSILFHDQSMILNGNGKYLRDVNDVIDIRGTTEEFYSLLKDMQSNECDQNLITYLKKARDMGAAWIFFKPFEEKQEEE